MKKEKHFCIDCTYCKINDPIYINYTCVIDIDEFNYITGERVISTCPCYTKNKKGLCKSFKIKDKKKDEVIK
jgi:hypothetical protein